jgi:hypothetical protein
MLEADFSLTLAAKSNLELSNVMCQAKAEQLNRQLEVHGSVTSGVVAG